VNAVPGYFGLSSLDAVIFETFLEKEESCISKHVFNQWMVRAADEASHPAPRHSA
jgi:hypothetical protein